MWSGTKMIQLCSEQVGPSRPPTRHFEAAARPTLRHWPFPGVLFLFCWGARPLARAIPEVLLVPFCEAIQWVIFKDATIVTTVWIIGANASRKTGLSVSFFTNLSMRSLHQDEPHWEEEVACLALYKVLIRASFAAQCEYTLQPLCSQHEWHTEIRATIQSRPLSQYTFYCPSGYNCPSRNEFHCPSGYVKYAYHIYDTCRKRQRNGAKDMIYKVN